MIFNPPPPSDRDGPDRDRGFDSDDVLANAPIGVYTSTPEGRFLAVNPAMARMFGHESPEAMIASVGDISADLYADPRDRDEFITSLSRMGQVTDHEIRMKRRDGSVMWISCNARKIHGERGALYQGFMIDITRRKEAEEALVLSERRHRIIFENSPLGMLLLDSEGTVVDCNDALVAIMGSTRERLIGFNATRLESPIARAGLQRALSGHPAFIEGEYTSVTGGVTRMLRANFRPLVPGRSPSGAIATLEDITEKADMQKAMQDREALQRTLLDILPVGVALVDEESGRIEQVNDHMGCLLLTTSDELTGRDCREILCASGDDVCPCASDADAADSVHAELLRRDGSRLWVIRKLKRIEFEGRGKFLECIVDVSDRRRTEEKLHDFARQMELKSVELDNARLKAEQAAREKDAFLSRMSHEIRTPLNGVIGMTGLLEETRLDETQRRYLKTLRTSGESLMEVVNDILDLSRIESGNIELENTDFDLRTMLDDIASMLAVKAAEKKIELISSADPDVPERFTGEPGFLRQIITNLAGNALKFTSKGEVEIRVSMADAGVPDMDSRMSGIRSAKLLFTIRDTGMGMTPEGLKRIFQDFSQADASITRRFGGSGLGLAISKRMVEFLGGEIGVQSVPGKGSTFWFTVPMQVGAPLKSEPSGIRRLQGLRALIVDGNTTTRETLMARFAAWGMRPEEAATGYEALARLRQGADQGDPCRLVLVDAALPGMDVRNFGGTVLAEPGLRETTLVLMTSLGQNESGEELDRTCFSSSLCKPIAHGELQACLNAIGKGRKAGAVRDRAPAPRASRTELPDFSSHGCRILMVEDNLTNQQVALGILANFGLEADIAGNGAEALEMLSRSSYSLVLMDIQMPVMDGLQCTRVVRDPASPVLDHDVPIIAMTAHAQASDRDRCLEAGMNAYVAKPISLKELAQTLGAWLTPGGKGPGESIAPPAAQDGGPATWDRQAFMDRILDDEELARDIVGGFMADSQKRLDSLQKAVLDGDLAMVVSQAHSIKGAAANLGAEVLQGTARRLETAARDGRTEACGPALEALQAAMLAFFEEVERLRGVS
jgi:PAS domain S-box-containing protein